MTIGHDNNPDARDRDARDFDATLRRSHAQAVEHVPARTLMQLRPQRAPSRNPASKPGPFAWPLAATCALALVAGGLLLRQPRDTDSTNTANPAVVATEEPADVYAALDESPDLYVWLASTDTTNLVME